MGRYFQDIDYPHFDYELNVVDCLAEHELRGPVPDLTKPYFVCLGASHVFGRFCKDPFPRLLSGALGIPVLNLGLCGRGPQAFLNDEMLAIINRAEFAIIQLVSARVGSNAAFTNSNSGRGVGLRLRDSKPMTFEEFLGEELEQSPHSVVRELVEQTRQSWVSLYRSLLASISVPKILHWFSTGLPYRSDDYSNQWRLLGNFPQLVNWSMIERIRSGADLYIETVCHSGLPQELWDSNERVSGTTLRGGKLLNSYYPSPEMHVRAASDLFSACRALVVKQELSSPDDGETILVLSNNDCDARVVTSWCGPRALYITYKQLRDDKELLTYMIARRRRIVHVRRRDLIKGFVSEMNSARLRRGKRPLYSIVSTNLLEYVEAADMAERLLARISPSVETLELFFDDLLADPDTAATAVATFTGRSKVTEVDIEAALSELAPNRDVENYHDLRVAFTRAADQFEDVTSEGE